MKYNQGVLTSYKMKFSSYFQDTAQQFKKKKKNKVCLQCIAHLFE